MITCEKNFSNWLKEAKPIFESPRFSLLDNDNFQVVEYQNPQVIVLPIVDRENIVMSKVFRKPVKQAIWELPAGGLNHNEKSDIGALREFREETGIEIHETARLFPLPSIVVCPNRMPMLPLIFQLNLTKSEFENRKSHDDEVEKVDLFTFSQIKQMIIENQIFASIPVSILSRFLLSQN